jgi:Concanavalin A-like lectin/glucanases superfamily/Immunoglobulin I-set domain/Immunoglobulin domain
LPNNVVKNLVRSRNWLTVICLATTFILLSIRSKALDVIDPTGVSYTSVIDDSEFNSSYTSANLFEADMTGVPLGASLNNKDFAKNGPGSCFVAFQLDRVYTDVASIFYAQRGANSTTVDKVWTISIWSSTNTSFTANDPGTAPDSVISVNHTPGAIWTEYLLTNRIVGQYFLLKLEQTSLVGNPGGREFRLGANLRQSPVLLQALQNKTVYVSGKPRFNVTASGTPPLRFQWAFDGNTLTNGGRISGADTPNLVVSDVTPSDAGTYSLTITNAYGTNSLATASLTVVQAPTNAVAKAILSNAPVAYWQLNEPVGANIPLDLVGSFNGVYGPSAGVGAVGPRPPEFPGFASTNTAVRTFAFNPSSTVALPSLNLSPTNAVTILAWIYSDVTSGPQNPYTGIVYCRGNNTSAGLICSADGTKLGYQWNNTRYFFDSGLVITTNHWTMVALVYTANATTLYCGTTNGLVLSATDQFSQAGQSFDSYTFVGLDTDVGESTRTFNGSIDDVAFFDRALSTAEISSIYSAGAGMDPALQLISQTTNQAVFLGDPFTLSAVVSGLNPVYQWFKQNAPVPDATNDTLTIDSAKVSDAGNYYLVASNQGNSVTGNVISVIVSNYLVRPLGLSGVIYTNISASSQYPNINYAGTNLFDSDLIGIALGTHLSGKDWADDGVTFALAPAYLAFQVDQVYQVNAIFYAQRNVNSGNPTDKITALSLWASETTPFTAADPGVAPGALISIPEIDAANLHRYILPTTMTGRYFLLKVEQNPTVVNSNIGGNEFRLGVFATPTLAFSASPIGLTLQWDYGTLQEADNVSGPWTTAVGIISGVPFPTTKTRSFYRILY